MEAEERSRQGILELNLEFFARLLGGHLFLADRERRVMRFSPRRGGVCGWTCARGLEPCVSTCLRPVLGESVLAVPRLTRCPMGLLVFTVPLRCRGEPLGILGGGGLSSAVPFSPDLSRLSPPVEDETSIRELTALASAQRTASPQYVMSFLEGARTVFEVILSSFNRQAEGERKVRQVEGLSAVLGGFFADLPPVEWAPSFLQSLALLFDIPALFIAFPRPFLPGLFVLESFGDGRLLPGGRGFNLPLSFPAPEGVDRSFHQEGDPLRIRDWGLPEGVRSVQLFRLEAAGHALGLMAVLDRSLGSEEAALVKSAAGAFTLNLLVARLERSQEEMREEREYLFSLVQDLMQEDDPDRVYDMLLRKASSVTGARKGSLMLLDQEGALKVRKALGFVEDSLLSGLAVQPGEGIAGRVFASGSPLWVKDMEKDLSPPVAPRGRYRTRSFIAVPLGAQGRTEGVLNLSDKETGGAFNRKDFDRVRIISEHGQLALARARYLERYREAMQLAVTDPLTGLPNRRHLLERLDAEIERCQRHGGELSVVMVDVDRFKEFNDLNGHQAGDAALKTIATVLKHEVRGMDLAARYGGEEFCLVLPELGEELALQVAERVRMTAEGILFPGEEGLSSGKLTLSLGVAVFPRVEGAARDLIYASDMALYRAKRGGRNRVCVATGEEEKAWHPVPPEPAVPRDPVPVSPRLPGIPGE